MILLQILLLTALLCTNTTIRTLNKEKESRKQEDRTK